MKHIVLCDLKGNIVAVGRAEPTAELGGPVGGLVPRPKRGQRVMEVDVPEDAARKLPSEIAEGYRVDAETGELTPRESSPMRRTRSRSRK